MQVIYSRLEGAGGCIISYSVAYDWDIIKRHSTKGAAAILAHKVSDGIGSVHDAPWTDGIDAASDVVDKL